MKENDGKMNDLQFNETAQEGLKEKIISIFEKHKHHLPEEKKPTILVCGKMGVGKTTTINTIFGSEVGAVGHITRGTSRDELYEWESNTDENINIIDLPGLGDSPKHDREFKEMYARRIKEADAFLVLVAPPRPAEAGTLKTIKLLLINKVPSKCIIIGYNKLGELTNHYEKKNGTLKKVEMDGLIGPVKITDINVIKEAKLALLKDLNEEIPKANFKESQIIEFDSDSGWNMHELLGAAVNVLPCYSALRFRKAANKAAMDVKKKEREKIRKERAKLEQEKEKLNQRLSIDSKKSSGKEEVIEITEVEYMDVEEVRLKRREDAIIDFEKEENKFYEIIGRVVVEAVAVVIGDVDRVASSFLREASKAVSYVGSGIKEGAKKVGNWFKSLF